MKARRARTLCALLCWQAASWPAEAQQALFHSAVSVVRLDVLATDGRRPLTGLTAADFEVRDNGRGVPVDIEPRTLRERWGNG